MGIYCLAKALPKLRAKSLPRRGNLSAKSIPTSSTKRMVSGRMNPVKM
nr:hypothetical protein Iba_chr14dCG11750 [Ipomoea batatas]